MIVEVAYALPDKQSLVSLEVEKRLLLLKRPSKPLEFLILLSR